MALWVLLTSPLLKAAQVLWAVTCTTKKAPQKVCFQQQLDPSSLRPLFSFQLLCVGSFLLPSTHLSPMVAGKETPAGFMKWELKLVFSFKVLKVKTVRVKLPALFA